MGRGQAGRREGVYPSVHGSLVLIAEKKDEMRSMLDRLDKISG